MKILSSNMLAAVSIGVVSTAASGATVPVSAATITTGAGGGAGFVTNSYSESGEIGRFFNDPESFLNDLNHFQLKGISNVESVVVGPQGAISSSNISNSGGSASASIKFANNDLALKTKAKGTITRLGYIPAPASAPCDLNTAEAGFTVNGSSCFVGETAVGFAVSALKDTPTISALTNTGSGFYQLLFDLTGNGVQQSSSPTKGKVLLDAFGALAVRNNGVLVIPQGDPRITSPRPITTALVPMTFGQAFELDIAFASAVSAKCLPEAVISGGRVRGVEGCEGTFNAEADFANTLTLVGVNVFDATERKINNFTFTSNAGISYFDSSSPTPVPEPSGLAGALIVLGGIASNSVSRRRTLARD